MPSKKVEKESFDAFVREGRSWETDRLLNAERSRRTAWWVAGAAGLIALAAVVAVAGLTPLKRTELRVVRVDNATGIVDVLSELSSSKESYEESVDKYFAQLYVRFREGYTRTLAEEYYYAVGLMSAPPEQRRYFDGFAPKNPQSPLNIYGTDTRVKTDIKSVSFVQKGVALVRYTRSIERTSGEKANVSHWAATIVYKYSGAPMSEKDRAINPLGYQVIEYRNDPEAAPDEQRRAAPSATAVQTPGPTLFPGVRAAQSQDQVPALQPVSPSTP